PVGPAEFITLDARHAYAGDHSPTIVLSPSEPRGIRQTGLTVMRGREYSGRIVLSGDPGVQVTVSLVWGTGADRQSVKINKLPADYVKFPLGFKSPVNGNAQLEITAVGPGTFCIGAVSLMPANNVQG